MKKRKTPDMERNEDGSVTVYLPNGIAIGDEVKVWGNGSIEITRGSRVIWSSGPRSEPVFIGEVDDSAEQKR